MQPDPLNLEPGAPPPPSKLAAIAAANHARHMADLLSQQQRLTTQAAASAAAAQHQHQQLAAMAAQTNYAHPRPQVVFVNAPQGKSAGTVILVWLVGLILCVLLGFTLIGCFAIPAILLVLLIWTVT